ncbi:BTB/POZ and TAZ domain-containing protein 4-like [Tasmannia lanceolata]|uniref:BTB/POZ and TAZ domain-containing protein 4-like n=1 Tax=Tasmannia lanceolata TaxID=3420 RepID=UPI004062EA5D
MVSPNAPPFACLVTKRKRLVHGLRGDTYIPTATRDLWDRLFREGYKADVHIITDGGDAIPAHTSILGMSSPVMKNMLEKSKGRNSKRSISIRGVPNQAVRVFIRFIYSSCYEQNEMNKFILHLLVLSHVFVIPSLKQECVQQLEKGLITKENVIDIFQLAQLCDTPRLCLICHRLILKSFKIVSASEGWKVMKESNPKLEKELLESVVEADSRKQEKMKKMEERKIYVQLYEAMEALVHICRDGCRTIRPHDKMLKRNEAPCNFSACKGLESLIRHFAGCKTRVPGGCLHCKRMWQLLELHSRLCNQPDVCRVSLCRNFKEKMPHQNKKDEVKWKLLVSKVLSAKKIVGKFSPSSSTGVILA